MIHGRGSGLEIVFAGRSFAEAHGDLHERLVGGPDFYRGTHATVVFDATPTMDELEALRVSLAEAGMAWDGAYGESELDGLLGVLGVPFLGRAPHPAVAALPARERLQREIALSESARSLVADFAGARSDLKDRRIRGPRRPRPEAVPNGKPVPVPDAASAPSASPAVLYHRGTLRGGQALANVGHIVVIGDVNPGAELVAGGDILVFGALRGVAHAGAQGDGSARVYALALAPTQLRIATTIAAGSDERPNLPAAEEAYLDGDRIVIVPAGQPALTSREQQTR